MLEDPHLLRRYVSERSQEAFAEIVRRRVDLVYSVALRQVGGDAHLAEDVTQKVFADLARKASTLLDRPALSGWLYRSAQYAASDMVRSERRRRAREQETYAMQDLTTTGETPVDWGKLRPLLDEAMGDLNDSDRDAVALRFFEGRPFADIGRALQLTEEAARKRVERALDKMAAALSRYGVTSTTTALGTALIGQASVAAPAGLASAVTGTVLGGAGAAVGVAWWSFFGSKALTVGAGTLAVVAGGVALHEAHQAGQRQAELDRLTGRHAQAQARVVELEQTLRTVTQQLETSRGRAAAAEEDTQRLLTAIQLHTGGGRSGMVAGAAASAPDEAGPITHQSVEARYRRAQQLARSGDPAEALRELLWCFDTGMVSVSSYTGVRLSFLLSDLVRLGERHPPALAALRERRDRAEKIFLSGENEHDATATFAAINQYLKETKRTIEAFDRLPEGDRRRTRLALSAYDDFVESRRYQDALTGRSFTMMRRQLEDNLVDRPMPPEIKNPESLRRAQRDYLVKSTAKNVEVLAGSGNVESAQNLATRLLQAVNTPEARATLQKHVERAGRPDILRML